MGKTGKNIREAVSFSCDDVPKSGEGTKKRKVGVDAAPAVAEKGQKETTAVRGADMKETKEVTTQDIPKGKKRKEPDTTSVADRAAKRPKGSQVEPTSDVKKKKRDQDQSSINVVVVGAAAYRKAHEIVLDGGECPDPLESFDIARKLLGDPLMDVMDAQGFFFPTPIQAQAWPIVLQGKDLIAVAETGSGKTLAFLLPAFKRIGERGPAPRPKKLEEFGHEAARPSSLVVVPTRELAQQIANEAKKFSGVVKARCGVVFGGVDRSLHRRFMIRGCDVLIATPGRLLELCSVDENRPDILPSVSLADVTYFVLDEADRLLYMGFVPDVRKIVAQCPASAVESANTNDASTARQTLFFTATWPKSVRDVAASFTRRGAVHLSISQGKSGKRLTANANVKQTVLVLAEEDKQPTLVRTLQRKLKASQTAIVFVTRKVVVDSIVRLLQRAGLNMWCRGIHKDKTQQERDETMNKFRRVVTDASHWDRGVLVATDVASRGLDIPDVSLIIIYDFGRSLISQSEGVEAYVHRIGRTGRAGNVGRAITFFTERDLGAAQLADVLRQSEQEVPATLQELAETEDERRAARVAAREERKAQAEEDERQGITRTETPRKGKGKGRGKGKGKGKDKRKSKDKLKAKGAGKGKDSGRGSGRGKGEGTAKDSSTTDKEKKKKKKTTSAEGNGET